MPLSTVIVGQLASMSRSEAARVIALTGGELSEHVGRDTGLVIIGSRGPQLQRNGRPPIQLSRARRLLRQGISLQVWPEDEWLRSVGLADDAAGVRKRFTATRLADTLQIPRAKLNRWIAAGLLRPAETSAGVPLFEFQHVAAARTLAELLQAGISLAKLRRAVANLSTWLPGANQPLMELTLDEEIQRLVVRTADGRLAEPSGQLLIEFDAEESIATIAFAANESETDAFRRAIDLEPEKPQEAAAIYRDLIVQRGPHATLAFNLGNALYAADDCEGALASYRQATELDSRHAGAWNNLANLLAELDRLDEAIEAYRRALALDPRLSDARFNLAQSLVETGRSDEAVLHWRAYLAADNESSWADYARERLESTRPNADS